MLYVILGSIFYFVYKFLYFFKVIGREHVPDSGVLFCCNHTSLSDPILVGISLDFVTGKHLNFMGKAELFKNKFIACILRKLGGFPVKRGSADISAIKESLRILNDGGRLLLFPQGTRNGSDGAKAGAGMLALRCDCTVVPVYISPGRKPFHRIRVVFGEAYKPETIEGKPSTADYQNIADEILRRIHALESKR